MGVLDEAIRDHLELRRRHGASDAEIARSEAEALGPARRDPAADIFAEGDAGAAGEETTILDPVSEEDVGRPLVGDFPPAGPVDTEGETAVYRLYGIGNVLLYVGLTNDFNTRSGQHEQGASWFAFVETEYLEFFDSRAEAFAAEWAAIRDEWPLYNVHGGRVRAPLPDDRDYCFKMAHLQATGRALP